MNRRMQVIHLHRHLRRNKDNRKKRNTYNGRDFPLQSVAAVEETLAFAIRRALSTLHQRFMDIQLLYTYLMLFVQHLYLIVQHRNFWL
jgi:hypothetical protein